MAEKKRKLAQPGRLRAVLPGGSAAKADDSDVSLRPNLTAEVWKEEVAGLRDKTFDSFSEAVDALATRVVARMGSSGLGKPEQIQFVADLIHMDPEMRATVARALKVKG